MSALDRWLHEGWLRAVDHALGATLQRLRPDAPDAVALAAALASRALEFGHSSLPLSGVALLLAETGVERALPAMPLLDDWRRDLAASPYVGNGDGDARGKPLVLERDRIALRRYWDYEVRLARALRGLAGPLHPVADDAALQLRLQTLFDPSATPDRQALAAFVAQHERLLLLTGGPGTGKTTTVARLLVLRIEQAMRERTRLRIALSAPTGKAAARLAESVRENVARLHDQGRIDDATQAAMPANATTLHRLLGWQPNATTFRHDAAHPLAVDLVVVDEASMVDLPLMCKLLEAIPPDASLILLGDRDQLPSVETGDVLAALCDAAGDGLALPFALAAAANATLGIALDTQPSSSPLLRIELARSYRQSDALDVAPLALAIRDGAVDDALAGLRAGAYCGLHWREGADTALTACVLEHALPHYRAIAEAPDVAQALTLSRRFRVLTAVREGEAGSSALNERIERALPKADAREGEFFHGRLVMIRENSYRHGLYNGDIGLCWRDADVGVRVWFDAAGGPRSWLPAALPRHESAFALTVHKSQGSEFDDVLLALPERGARVISRELLYTGLTRARHGLTLWATAPVLADAIARRAQRWSGLADRLLQRDPLQGAADDATAAGAASKPFNSSMI
jgi:exodeoxyribonuclease V alpha subunit